jgi:hypothetical protein
MQPWEAHPDLTPARLMYISRMFSREWRRSKRSHRPRLGDRAWGFGAKINERLRHALALASHQNTWLRLVIRDLHFVFAVGEVPVRFYRGRSRIAKENFMRRRRAELSQQQLAFPEAMGGPLECLYRFVIEGDVDGPAPEIYLVQINAKSGVITEAWPITARGRALVSTSPAPVTVPQVRGHVPIAAPVVTRKHRKKADASGDG